MITSIKNERYSFLFQEASELLVKKHFAGELGDEPLDNDELKILCPPSGLEPAKDENGNYIGVGRFTSLEQYFTRLGTLVAHASNPMKYLMLPLDEERFVVNANTRTITVPKVFNKGAGVQGDEIAETLLLEIDRFFDHMDFLEPEAYIQWKLSDAAKTEGADRITYIDYETEHSAGKLILAWPLRSEITQFAGKVEFSLRFIKRSGTEIVYSWNSLPCTITINAALNPEIKYSEADTADALFKLAISNSKHTSKGDEVTEPSFKAPAGFGFAQGETAYLLANPDGTHDANTLHLEAAAFITDQGRLSYVWEYRNLEGDEVYTGTDINVRQIEAGVDYRVISDDETLPIDHKVYYEKSGNVFVQYDTQDWADDRLAGKEIYERYAYCDVAPYNGNDPAAGRATGMYTLTATHKLGFDSEDKVISVVVPGPEKLEFVKDLPTGDVFIDENGNVELEVAMVNDGAPASAWQSMTYDWRRCTSSAEGTMETIAGVANAPKVTIANAVPGWYEVGVTSMLNRDVKTEDSTICRITNDPVAPDLEFPYEADPTKDNSREFYASAFTNKVVTISADLATPYAEPNELYTDELVYEWYENGNLINSTAYPEISGQGTSTLVIDGKMKPAGSSLVIKCSVTNKLGSKSATSETGTYLVICN